MEKLWLKFGDLWMDISGDMKFSLSCALVWQIGELLAHLYFCFVFHLDASFLLCFNHPLVHLSLSH